MGFSTIKSRCWLILLSFCLVSSSFRAFVSLSFAYFLRSFSCPGGLFFLFFFNCWILDLFLTAMVHLSLPRSKLGSSTVLYQKDQLRRYCINNELAWWCWFGERLCVYIWCSGPTLSYDFKIRSTAILCRKKYQVVISSQTTRRVSLRWVFSRLCAFLRLMNHHIHFVHSSTRWKIHCYHFQI